MRPASSHWPPAWRDARPSTSPSSRATRTGSTSSAGWRSRPGSGTSRTSCRSTGGSSQRPAASASRATVITRLFEVGTTRRTQGRDRNEADERRTMSTMTEPGCWAGSRLARNMLSGVADFVERRPERAFWVFVALHFALWTGVPISFHRNPALDLVEGVTFGQQWQVVYWKHPPLPWLIVDTVRRAFGPELWPMLIVAQLSNALALWAVWRLAREIVPPLPAFLSAALLEGTRSLTYGSEA